MSATAFPKHVAIVMDGNGRWARERSLPRHSGHEEGAKAVSRTIEYAVSAGIEVLTLFAMSAENMRHRPKEEIEALFALFTEALTAHLPSLHSHNIAIRVIGSREGLDEALCQRIADAEQQTASNTGMVLVLAVNYSGTRDLTLAARQLVQSGFPASDVTEAVIAERLSLSDLPPPDLFIRTSGEMRLSNFMLWQMAYTELYFTPVLWPDFSVEDFKAALSDFSKRTRRYGYTSEQIQAHHV